MMAKSTVFFLGWVPRAAFASMVLTWTYLRWLGQRPQKRKHMDKTASPSTIFNIYILKHVVCNISAHRCAVTNKNEVESYSITNQPPTIQEQGSINRRTTSFKNKSERYFYYNCVAV